ncbi:O-antigen ligase family protein [Paenibacillus xerothermodurans]|uniref:O-antigen ligase family protein n=1 Tax=Paenibacillus xerothermodurans TaxID=1977292 RepID=UPI00140234A0|nr:O-antigen ligase family protein [Paenibacillus xerothermodurans]
MYKDSLKVFQDYPLTGAGGGAWFNLYQQYQNNPYTVKQVHNFFLQYLNETGLIGFFALMVLLISVFVLYARQFFKQDHSERGTHQIFYIVAVSLLVHSVLDFEMSYAYLAALVFLCLGGMAASIGQPVPLLSSQHIAALNKGAFRLIYPSAVGILSLVIIFAAVRELQGNRYYAETMHMLTTQQDLAMDDVFRPLGAALHVSTEHPEYLNLKIQLLYQGYNQTKDARFEQQAKQYLAELDHSSPYDKQRLEFEYNQYVSEDKLDEALAVTERSLQQGIWGINASRGGPNWYTRAIALSYELGERARADRQPELQAKRWDRAEELYQTAVAKKESLKALPPGQLQGELFDIAPDMSLFVGQINFQRSNHERAAELFKQHVSDQTDDPLNRTLVRWYLAALQKQGKSDSAVYDAFVTKHPEEQEQIAKLVSDNS